MAYFLLVTAFSISSILSFGFNGMASITDSLQAVSKCEYRKDAVSSVSNVCRAAHLFPTLVRKSQRISLSYCNVVQSYGIVLLFFFVFAIKLNFMCAVTIWWSDSTLTNVL